MIRVLQVTGTLDIGGIETLLVNYHSFIDRSRFAFDYLLSVPEESHYESAVRELGGRIFRHDFEKASSSGYRRSLRRFLRQHPEIDVIHFHNATPSVALMLREARSCGVPVRIAHGHSVLAYNPLKKLLIPLLRHFSTHCLACSQAAGIALFGRSILKSKKWLLLPNAADVEALAFSQSRRAALRGSLGLENKCVLIHVGRLEPVKNQFFLLELFSELLKTVARAEREGDGGVDGNGGDGYGGGDGGDGNGCGGNGGDGYGGVDDGCDSDESDDGGDTAGKGLDAVLLLVGDGALGDRLEAYATELGILGRVRFLGWRNDIAELLQAGDIFLLPSLSEGLGMAAIEAQASGMPCVLSDGIPREAKINQNVEFLPINQGCDVWVSKILQLLREPADRESLSRAVSASEYNIRVAVRQLEAVYTSAERCPGKR
jgi:glycosyltransferase involved in cell wall biosynthesis